MHVLPEITIDICEIFGTFVIFKKFGMFEKYDMATNKYLITTR